MNLNGTCRFSGDHFSAYIPEYGLKIDQKFLTRLLLFVKEQWAIVFAIVFCNPKIPKQGKEMQIFLHR